MCSQRIQRVINYGEYGVVKGRKAYFMMKYTHQVKEYRLRLHFV